MPVSSLAERHGIIDVDWMLFVARPTARCARTTKRPKVLWNGNAACGIGRGAAMYEVKGRQYFGGARFVENNSGGGHVRPRRPDARFLSSARPSYVAFAYRENSW